MQEIILSFITAFSLTYFAIPPIIQIALEKNLCDQPDERRVHKVPTPSLGGIAMFGGILFSLVLWTPQIAFGDLQYIFCSFILIFLIGAKDDISPVSATKKMGAQFIAAVILVFKSDIHLTSLHGLFGSHGLLPEWISITISIFTIIVIMNAFNLIDGINGLAGSLVALITGTLGCWFWLIGEMAYTVLAFSTAGAVLSFLRYNFSPAKIFMGDTGSLILGMICAILIIRFIEFNDSASDTSTYLFSSVPVVAIGIMIIPLFDTFRVFVTRAIRGHSPFKADRRHIHHLLIDYGFGHTQATGILMLTNMLFMMIVFSLDSLLDIHILLLLVILLATSSTYFLHRSVVLKNQTRS
ncbi:MAG TPA: MraY family glycosyltransferase [Saprospiraceae bacterium]|nr:MraY family glycosyltransferase [Saprospiraceae bacterium]